MWRESSLLVLRIFGARSTTYIHTYDEWCMYIHMKYLLLMTYVCVSCTIIHTCMLSQDRKKSFFSPYADGANPLSPAIQVCSVHAKNTERHTIAGSPRHVCQQRHQYCTTTSARCRDVRPNQLVHRRWVVRLQPVFFHASFVHVGKRAGKAASLLRRRRRVFVIWRFH